MNTEKKNYWYCFVYQTEREIAHTYTGYEQEGITLPMIKKNKEYAGVDKGVLINIIPLGYMTAEEFQGINS